MATVIAFAASVLVTAARVQARTQPCAFAVSRPTQHRSRSACLQASGADVGTDAQADMHTVDGVVCRRIPLEVPSVGTVSVLEATAESQEDLVDVALLLDDEQTRQDGSGVLRAGDPYGAVLWPAAWAVSKYLSEQSLDGLTICELGTGTGLVSLTAVKAGAERVIASDYEPLALSLTKYAASELNDCDMSRMEFVELDMGDDGTPLPADVDIVVAADIMYEIPTGTAMARRAVEALRNGSRVIVGDSPGRAGRPAFLNTLQQLGVRDAAFRDAIGKTCSGPRHELICGTDSPSVSSVPQELPVAIMDLAPSQLRQ